MIGDQQLATSQQQPALSAEQASRSLTLLRRPHADDAVDNVIALALTEQTLALHRPRANVAVGNVMEDKP